MAKRPRKTRSTRQRAPRRPPRRPPPLFKPQVHAKLSPVLQRIGVPGKAPFVPDPFQVQAVETLASSDVVVSAPTGSGKTWIAEQAIAAELEAGRQAWYASPLKALSNAKYAEFGARFGPERVGILTGDRKENLAAPLIVGTTEILRNQLYDAMHRGSQLSVSLVVLDEAHYLGDPDRGVVWEEVIIYLPPRVRLLLLSATVDNAAQIARWLEFVRDQRCATVISQERPVPLEPLFLFPDGLLSPLLGRGGLFPSVRHFVEGQRSRSGRITLSHKPAFGRILTALQFADLLPAIFFLKSRSECDQALAIAAGAELERGEEQTARLEEVVTDYEERYPFLSGHPHLHYLRRHGVAAHHAGHLPHWKLLVERLMQGGLLKAIFSTSTVAAGVNFPARTVVITQSDRFDGRDFVDLTATDLLQMTGRAGRRGMDKVGFCLINPGPFTDVRLVASLLAARPEPIESRVAIGFSMALNLLLSHRPAEIKQLLGLSLGTFQRLERERKRPGLDKRPQRVLAELQKALAGSACAGPEEAVVRLRRRRQLEGLIRRLRRQIEQKGDLHGLRGALIRGRVFMDMYGTLAAVLRRETQGELAGVLAVSLDHYRALRRGKPRLDFVPYDEVAGIYQEILELPPAGGGRALAAAVMAQIPKDPKPLDMAELDKLGEADRAALSAELVAVEEELAYLPCAACPQDKDCGSPAGELGRLLEKAEVTMNLLHEESQALWFDFVRHLEFLRSEGFVDQHGRLTPDGEWASQLRLDQPVLIAQAIRRDVLPQGDPVLLAALLALFVDDRERETEGRTLPGRLQTGVQKLRLALDPLMARLKQWGFTIPPLPPAAAAAIFAWCQLAEFSDAVAIYGADEGDLASLIYRTADNLRQVISLGQTHPKLAASAREAVELLLRPPVVVPV